MSLKELTIYMSKLLLQNPIFLFLFIVGIIGIIINIIKKIKQIKKELHKK